MESSASKTKRVKKNIFILKKSVEELRGIISGTEGINDDELIKILGFLEKNRKIDT